MEEENGEEKWGEQGREGEGGEGGEGSGRPDGPAAIVGCDDVLVVGENGGKEKGTTQKRRKSSASEAFFGDKNG